MNFFKYLPIIILFSCGSSNVSKPVAPEKWFDLKQFVQNANAILPKNALLEKTLQVGGKTETKKTTVADWSAELSVFGQSDLNRPAWRSKYQVDTVHLTVTNDTATAHQIRHLAKDKSLKTNYLVIHTNRKQEPIFIEIQQAQNTFFSESKQHLVWSLQKGYSMTAYQKMIFSAPTETVLSGYLTHF
jgi:hypothetical protein